jgi:hypothetical protein
MERSPLSPAEDQLTGERRIAGIDLNGFPCKKHMHDIFLTHPSLRHAFNGMALIDDPVLWHNTAPYCDFPTRVAYTLKSFGAQMAVGVATWIIGSKTGPSRRRTIGETVHFLLATAYPGRPWPKQDRAHRRKCPLARATPHPQATGEAASMYEDGSGAPRAFSKAGSDLGPSPAHRPARDAAALAS